MDNLEIIFKYDVPIGADFGNILVSSFEESNCSFYTDKKDLYVFDYDDVQLTTEKNVAVIRCSSQHIENVKHLKYLTLSKFLFIANDTTLMFHKDKTHNLEIAYSLPEKTKILTTSWNPDETVLVVIDSDYVLYGFTFEFSTHSSRFEFLTFQQNAHIDDAVPESVYVGWGSHDTQFKGSKKAHETIEEFSQEFDVPVVSWRGNGEQFVVNFWKEERRYLKVFDSTLKPLYQSLAYPNLLKPTSFKGQGNFIACVAGTSEQNHKVVIFEKNCLVKSEFSVPENKGHIKDVLYHPDQNLLAVYSTEELGSSYLNIYFLSNAHWYLKQQLVFSADEIVKSFKWSEVMTKSSIKLDILTSKFIYQFFLRYVFNRLCEIPTVFVIDGRKVYVIDYSLKILPPPILDGHECQFLETDDPVNEILCHQTERAFICIDSTKKEYHYSYVNGRLEKKEVFSSTAPFLSEESTCLEFNEILMPLDVLHGSIYCTAYKIDEKVYKFSIDRNLDLSRDNTPIFSNVLSMYIYENYLLLTRASSELFCLRLNPEALNKPWPLNYYSREVAQGAKIVCVTKTGEIVMEVPRGDLETITCGLISIDKVEKMLTENKWKEAVEFIRKDRLNWNILIDLNPERFLKNIKEFVEAAEYVSVLIQIITEFSKENSLETMYLQYSKESIFIPTSGFDKQKAMLEILKYLIVLNPVSNLDAIVNLQIKHFSLKSALKSVCAVFQSGEVEVSKKAVNQILLHCNSKDVINSAFAIYDIDFMSFIFSCCSEDPRVFEPELDRLKDILDPVELRFEMNLLAKNFKGATMYLVNSIQYEEDFVSDFLIKNQTQQVAYESVTPANPNFKLCSKLYAKFLTIKKKYDEAGFILCKAELYAEALIKFKIALNCPRVLSLIAQLKLEENEKKKIISELAEGLVNQKRIDEAVNLYEFHLQDSKKAIEVLLDKNMYQRAMCMATKYEYLDLIDDKIKPAILKYRSDLQEKITDLKTTFLKYTQRLGEIRCRRLLYLKKKQSGDDTDNMGDNSDMHSEYGSVFSSIGQTTSSDRSKISTMSSRQRRKQEKKKLNIREGGTYEDIALVRHLYNLILDIFACGQDVKEICLTLTDNESFEQCKKLHSVLCDAQDVVKVNIPKIWTEVFVNASQLAELEVLAETHNRDKLDVEFRTPPPSEKLDESWKLNIYS